MQYVIIAILVVAAVGFMGWWLYGKFRGACNCGCGSKKKTKPTRATLTIGGKHVADHH